MLCPQLQVIDCTICAQDRYETGMRRVPMGRGRAHVSTGREALQALTPGVWSYSDRHWSGFEVNG
jgi:hypothetical protein